jgi:hypothetical protein
MSSYTSIQPCYILISKQSKIPKQDVMKLFPLPGSLLRVAGRLLVKATWSFQSKPAYYFSKRP